MSLRAKRGVSFTAVADSGFFSGRGAARLLAHYVRVGMTADRNDRGWYWKGSSKISLRFAGRRREESFFSTVSEPDFFQEEEPGDSSLTTFAS